MDVSRYEFACQKALHQGLQYARSLGHQLLEVEHVALAFLKGESAAVDSRVSDRLKRHIESYLSKLPRIFGTIKVEFGNRLDQALDQVEAAAGVALVDDKALWESLCRHSTTIQLFFAKIAQDSTRSSGAKSGSVSESSSKSRQADQQFNRRKDDLGSKKTSKPRPASEISEKLAKILEQFTVDLTSMAARGELDPVIGRDFETRRVLEILGRKKKNNPLLIGEAGVGKSAIAEAIAQNLADGRVPETMRGKRVLSLDVGGLLAGAKFRGEFEERLKNVVAALDALNGQVILFIDEIHMLVGAGNHEGGTDAANLLKPALARGELQCLGATTLDEYRKYIENDPAMERRFQPVMIEEPPRETCLSILRGVKSRYEIHHGVQIDDSALISAIEFSVRYIPDRKLPDKAIDIIDEAASRLRLEIESVPAVIYELGSQINQIEVERKAIPRTPENLATHLKLEVRLEKTKNEYDEMESIWRHHQGLLEQLKSIEKERTESASLYENAKASGDYEFAAKVQYNELPRIEKERAETRSELVALQEKYTFLRQKVGTREVAEVVAAWTRIPVMRLVESEHQKILDLESRLSRRIFGQSAAIDRISRAVRRARVGINDPRRPVGVFLFLGPTGVGKTEMAKALAAELFSDEGRVIRIDMSEFMDEHNVSRLIGSPPGYVGYQDGGQLTDRVRNHPYSVILLDEMEKAHPRVLDILLQVFEDGRLTDGKGRIANFRNAIIIMTSNIHLESANVPELIDDSIIRNELSSRLRPEFVNRIDEVVVFRQLGKYHLEFILEKLLFELNERLRDRQLRIIVGPRLAERLIAQSGTNNFGGRALRRVFDAIVVDSVSDRLLLDPAKATGAWVIDLNSNGHCTWSEEFTPSRYLPPINR